MTNSFKARTTLEVGKHKYDILSLAALRRTTSTACRSR